MNLHVGAPNPVNRKSFFSNLKIALDANWITNCGYLNNELEVKIEELLEVKHCICVSNATTGLQILYHALNLTGEVIIPSFTFVATAHSLKFLKIEPVFCDIDPKTHLIDSTKIEALITNKTSAILGVPIWGQPLNYKELEAIAEKYNLKLIFDSAHAFGCKSENKYIGGFGDAEVFSFHATKIFSCGEGGAVTTNCDELAEKLRYMRNFGFCDYDKTLSVGINAKMSELSSAYGLSHLDDLEKNIKHNQLINSYYTEEFANYQSIKFLKYNFKGKSNNQYVVAVVKPQLRDKIIRILHSEGVIVRKYFYPGCHRLEPYVSHSKYQSIQLPVTDYIAKRIIVFPTGQQSSLESVLKIKKLIKDHLI